MSTHSNCPLHGTALDTGGKCATCEYEKMVGPLAHSRFPTHTAGTASTIGKSFAAAPSGEPSDERPWCCPVCNGAGHINRPPWIAGDQPTYTTAEIRTYPCNACGGTGIVWRSRAASVPASPAGDEAATT